MLMSPSCICARTHMLVVLRQGIDGNEQGQSGFAYTSVAYTSVAYIPSCVAYIVSHTFHLKTLK